jgi:DNA mismatch repair protein MutS2
MQTLEHEHRLLARERETIAEAVAKLQSRELELRNREETFKKRLDERVEERLRGARREVDAVLDRLKARTGALAADADRRAARLIPTGATGAARSEARAALDAIGERLRTGAGSAETPGPAHAVQDRPAAVGDRVLVGGFGLEGVVKSIHDREAEIDVRGKRLRARVNELRVIGGAAPSAKAKVRVNVDLQPRQGSLTELNLIGCSVDEALSRTEKFLDDSLVSDVHSVRLIHGFGTGQLRRAIAQHLQALPFVASFSAAPPEQGGGGVTVVELKD